MRRGKSGGHTNFKLVYLSALLLVSLCLPAGRAYAQFDLTINFRGFGPHVYQLFKARVVNVGSNQQVDEVVLDSIDQPDFTVRFSNILEAGQSYNIDAFADYNRNGKYDPPPEDHTWRWSLNNVSGDTLLTLFHSINWKDIDYPNADTTDVEPPDTMDICDCDLNGDGVSDVGDMLEWIMQVRSGEDNLCLDYNRDGDLGIADLLSLLLDIRAGGCVGEQAVLKSN